MIIGLTHDEQGSVRIRRSVTAKVAIGRAPAPSKGKNYPEKLDHFILLKKGNVDGKVEWVADDEKQKHYGDKPTTLSIVLLDDNPDDVFRTEYAWYGKTGRKCWGNGNNATRRTDKNPDGVPWTPCANDGCADLDRGECKPSGDLYFMLADYPSLGTVCRLHTSSYQSIQELYTALIDLRAMMGGRLFGLPVTLFVRPEKNVYKDKHDHDVTGTKYILGLELSAQSLPKMLEGVAESAKVFAELRRLMAGRTLEIEEDDETRGPEIAGEFYPAERLLQAVPLPEDPLIAECKTLMEQAGVNAAGQSMMLGQYQGNLAELKQKLQVPEAAPAQVGASLPPEPKGKAVKGRRSSHANPVEAVAPAAAPAAKTGFDF